MECPRGYLFGHPPGRTSRTHLVKCEPWEFHALCGVGCFEDGLTDYGTRDNICPKCLKLLEQQKKATT